MESHTLTFEPGKRFWSPEREAVNFFARHDGIELEFIVTRTALSAVGNLTATLNEANALLTFDNYEDVFQGAATRVWRAADDSKPVYFINEDDVQASV